MTRGTRRDTAADRRRCGSACRLAVLVVSTAALWTSAVGTSALAQSRAQSPGDGEALANSKRCNACHTIDATLLGPPYRAVAARHADDPELKIEVLARKIVHGGAGNWGVVPMVPNEHVSLDEARTIAAWILSLND